MARKTTMVGFGIVVALAAVGCYGKSGMDFGGGGGGGAARAEAVIAAWPATPKKVAQQMIAKYGQPREVTPSHLVWYGNGPWKTTILSREEVPHKFPKAHTDLLEQAIDYRVPIDKFDELAAYDGSVIAERTKGEISARCDKEEMNFLALNLANDVALGRRSIEDARGFYAQTAMAFMQGQRPPYTQRLQFAVQSNTADPDQPHQMVGFNIR